MLFYYRASMLPKSSSGNPKTETTKYPGSSDHDHVQMGSCPPRLRDTVPIILPQPGVEPPRSRFEVYLMEVNPRFETVFVVEDCFGQYLCGNQPEIKRARNSEGVRLGGQM
jgi:hypothetical protein